MAPRVSTRAREDRGDGGGPRTNPGHRNRRSRCAIGGRPAGARWQSASVAGPGTRGEGRRARMAPNSVFWPRARACVFASNGRFRGSFSRSRTRLHSAAAPSATCGGPEVGLRAWEGKCAIAAACGARTSLLNATCARCAAVPAAESRPNDAVAAHANVAAATTPPPLSVRARARERALRRSLLRCASSAPSSLVDDTAADAAAATTAAAADISS